MTIQGLPLHVLLVHAVVVLVPLVALGGVAISTMRWARLRYGSLVLVGALGATVATFITQEAGETFAATFPQPSPTMAKHFALGGQLLVWVILMALGIVAVVLAQRLIDRDHKRGRLVLVIGAVVTIACAVVSVIQTVRIGHSGAIAVWGVS